MGATEEKIARFIVETSDKDIPPEAIKSAKIGSFDAVGAMELLPMPWTSMTVEALGTPPASCCHPSFHLGSVWAPPARTSSMPT
jgi:hypothetical protein